MVTGSRTQETIRVRCPRCEGELTYTPTPDREFVVAICLCRGGLPTKCGQPIQLTAEQQKQVATYMPFARHVARTFRHLGVPIEDLEQVAYIGLINAVHHFNPASNVKFETYARHMVAGEIRHYIRETTAAW